MGFWVRHLRLYQTLMRMGVRDPRRLLHMGPKSPDREESAEWIRKNGIADFGRFRMKLSVESPQDICYNAYRMFGEDYEHETVSLLRQNLRKGDTFLDIGANSGYFSLYMAGLCSRVIAVEANPRAYERLRANIELNNFMNIEPFNIALSDKRGTARFWVDEGNDGESSLSPVVLPYSAARRTFIDVQTDTIDNILLGGGADVMKIDVEGFEHEVLKGGMRTIGNIRLIVFEQSLDILDRKDEAIDKNVVISFLRDNGFTVRKITREGTPGAEIHDYREADTITSNLCAIGPDR